MSFTDYLVFTALDREWEAARTVLTSDANRKRTDDARTYYTWTVPVQRDREPDGEYLVAAAPMSQWTDGQTKAAIFTTQSINDWNPKHIVLLGIAGSLEPDRIQLGDVVVSSRIYGYEIVTADEGEDHFLPTQNQASAQDEDWARTFQRDTDLWKSWQDECIIAANNAGIRIERPPKMFVEVTASGNKVVRSRKFGKQLREQIYPYIAAVEMEASGMYKAVKQNGGNQDALMIRGISDYADETKQKLDDETGQMWHSYASANAARLLRAFWRSGIYKPLSQPYALDLSLGEPIRFQQTLTSNGVSIPVSDIRFKNRGAQHLPFPNFLGRPGSITPPLYVIISAMTHSGQPQTNFSGLCVLHAPEVEEIRPTSPRKGELLFHLPPSDRGIHAELLLSFAESCQTVSVRCEDDFGRVVEKTLNISQNDTTTKMRAYKEAHASLHSTLISLEPVYTIKKDPLTDAIEFLLEPKSLATFRVALNKNRMNLVSYARDPEMHIWYDREPPLRGALEILQNYSVRFEQIMPRSEIHLSEREEPNQNTIQPLDAYSLNSCVFETLGAFRSILFGIMKKLDDGMSALSEQESLLLSDVQDHSQFQKAFNGLVSVDFINVDSLQNFETWWTIIAPELSSISRQFHFLQVPCHACFLRSALVVYVAHEGRNSTDMVRGCSENEEIMLDEQEIENVKYEILTKYQKLRQQVIGLFMYMDQKLIRQLEGM